MNKSKTTQMAFIALFAALTGVLSQIAIPLPFTPLPINLALLAVFVAGGLLGWKNATISQLVYILLGAIGIPVFTKFSGGVGILLGPTGGFIIGYVLCALVIGLLAGRMPNKVWCVAVAMIAGLVVCYTVGTIGFIVVTGNGIVSALTACVLPFLVGDAIKILVGSIVVVRLKKMLKW